MYCRKYFTPLCSQLHPPLDILIFKLLFSFPFSSDRVFLFLIPNIQQLNLQKIFILEMTNIIMLTVALTLNHSSVRYIIVFLFCITKTSNHFWSVNT